MTTFTLQHNLNSIRQAFLVLCQSLHVVLQMGIGTHSGPVYQFLDKSSLGIMLIQKYNFMPVRLCYLLILLVTFSSIITGLYSTTCWRIKTKLQFSLLTED